MTILGAMTLASTGCMTADSDTSPPPSKGQSGSSPGMSEHTSEGVHSTR